MKADCSQETVLPFGSTSSLRQRCGGAENNSRSLRRAFVLEVRHLRPGKCEDGPEEAREEKGTSRTTSGEERLIIEAVGFPFWWNEEIPDQPDGTDDSAHHANKQSYSILDVVDARGAKTTLVHWAAAWREAEGVVVFVSNNHEYETHDH